MTAKLGKREFEMTKYAAWGATKKDISNLLHVSIRTVENTFRKVFEKTGVTKVNELSAWFFCHEFNISMDLSPLKRQLGCIALLFLFSAQLYFSDCKMNRRRSISAKENRTEKTSRTRTSGRLKEMESELLIDYLIYS
jgi:DNA-binding CsgD family transcriptional regulator